MGGVGEGEGTALSLPPGSSGAPCGDCGVDMLQVGQEVKVTVEAMFDGGMVVCYQDNISGTIVRGALLEIPTAPYVHCT